MNTPVRYKIEPYGEHGWIAQLDDTNDMVGAALYATAVADTLRNQAGIIDAVAGIESLVIKIDPTIISIVMAHNILEQAFATTAAQLKTPPKTFDIPVCYGGLYGPDLEAISKHAALSLEDCIKLHATNAYRVLTIGFAPGFAYLGPLDSALTAPRLATPRARVAAGSVAVAGSMTGVYPLSSPGGWNIIGRTPIKLFDSKAAAPFLFSPGMEIRFTQISENEFHELESLVQ